MTKKLTWSSTEESQSTVKQINPIISKDGAFVRQLQGIADAIVNYIQLGSSLLQTPGRQKGGRSEISLRDGSINARQA